MVAGTFGVTFGVAFGVAFGFWGCAEGPSDTEEQAACAPTRIAAAPHLKPFEKKNAAPMDVILLEALAAMVLLLFIVWWTMFSGRKRGERHDEADEEKNDKGGDKEERP